MRKLLLSSVALIAMPALADPVIDTRKIMAGTVTTTKIKNEYLSGARDGTTVFKGALSAYKAVRAAEPPLTVKCVDGTVIVAPGACPVPVPPVTVPVFTPSSSVSPTLQGLPAIASEFDPALSMVSGPLPGPDEVEGAFRFVCGPGQVLRDDPILYPGQPGKSHLHQFYGSLTANAASTYESLRAGGDSTCGFTGNGRPLNRSGYWQPAMLDGRGNVVRPDFVTIYYKRRPASDPVVSAWAPAPDAMKRQGKANDLPNGLRFIFGWDPTLSTSFKTGSAWFNCDGPTAGPSSHYPDLKAALAICPAGNRVGASIIAPSCWNGRDLDSPNHRDHVAYAAYNDWGYLQCDKDHPYVIPQFTLQAWYSIEVGDDTRLWHFSSDEMLPGVVPGYTFHADWFGAWDPVALKAWTDNCINKLLSCQAGNLGNGKGLLHGEQPYYLLNGQIAPSMKALPRLVPVP